MSQRTLAEDSTLPETDQLLSYSTRRLGAQDTTADLHTEARAALTTLRGDASFVRDAVEARMAARPVLCSKTEDLCRGIANVSRRALAELINDREDPRYAHAFPRPASEVVRGAISDEKVAYREVVISHLSAEATLSGLAPQPERRPGAPRRGEGRARQPHRDGHRRACRRGHPQTQPRRRA